MHRPENPNGWLCSHAELGDQRLDNGRCFLYKYVCDADLNDSDSSV